jgi:predicted deacetylase
MLSLDPTHGPLAPSGRMHSSSTDSSRVRHGGDTGRTLVVSLHDVSPRTRDDCQAILEELARLGVPCCSLLVIPDHHHRGHMRDDPGFAEWLREQAEAGHEIVMHGYYHQRERRAGESAWDKLTTRLYTADEGEFYDLDRAGAAALVTKARDEFQGLGLTPTGFIAPAWLLSETAEDALRDLRVEYTTRLASVVDLESNRVHRSQSLVWSVRSGWRRWTSLRWNALLFRRLAACPLLRISIHPVDLRHPTIWQQIGELAAEALADREPLTYHAWLLRQRAVAS